MQNQAVYWGILSIFLLDTFKSNRYEEHHTSYKAARLSQLCRGD